jgi:ATP-dependent RNA helicase DeaD
LGPLGAKAWRVPGIKAVVLTSTVDRVRRIVQEFHRLAGSRKKAPSILPIGLDADTRKEARQVQENPEILIGTPEKLIDHIRRGSVGFSTLQILVIDRPPAAENPEFDKDIRFIRSKLPPRVQTALFSPTLDNRAGDPLDLLKRPQVVLALRWRQRAPRVEHRFYEVQDGQKLSLLRDLILARPLGSALVLVGTPAAAERVARELHRAGLPALALHGQLPPPKLQQALQASMSGRSTILVSTYQEAAGRKPKWVSTVIHYDLPAGCNGYGSEGFLRLDSSVLRTVISLGTEGDFKKLQGSQEKTSVDIQKEEHPKEEDVIGGSIRRIVSRIREEEDPQELNYFRRQIRKNVPLLLRSYFMAYLFRSSLGQFREKKEKYTKLFVSIGKNRQVFPRDLIGLFMERLNLKRPQIGEVKVLENYSFIEVAASRAKEAIAQLSGTDFKGRKIAVNFARQKKEEKPTS